jgi:maltose O-acetyltransferase
MKVFFWTSFYFLFGFLFFEKLGKGCRFEGWIEIPQSGGTIKIGNGVRISKYVQFTVPRRGCLEIEDNVFINRAVMISAHSKVVVGKYSMLAENVCIHDNNHKFQLSNRPFCEQGFVAKPLIIGSNSWIGTGAKLLMGSSIGESCVVGAGAVLLTEIGDQSIACGVPARVIKKLV